MADAELPIRVLIVDDAVLYRSILEKAVAQIPGTTVVGVAASGAIALQKLASTSVDLVLLDVFMPDMDGVQTLQHIRHDFPDVAVVMVSGVATNDAEITIQALNLGALDFIPKPKEKNAEESMRVMVENLQRVFRIVRVHLHARVHKEKPSPLAAPPVKPPPPKPSIKPSKFDLVLIGVSTGGPNALNVVIPALPASLSCPVMLVQHMPPVFTASLADHLHKRSKLAVHEGIENQPLAKGAIWIAPGGRHMIIKHDPKNLAAFAIGLNDQPPVNSCRPAVDVLFRSAAEIVSGGILAVILTGMGEDGAAGVAALKHKSCYCLAQDEKTCVVYGMPRAIAERGLADEILPLEAIADRIAALVH